MRSARFWQQRAEEARIAADEANRLYWRLLISKYPRTFRMLARQHWPHVAAYSEIRQASEGNKLSMRAIRRAFKRRHLR